MNRVSSQIQQCLSFVPLLRGKRQKFEKCRLKFVTKCTLYSTLLFALIFIIYDINDNWIRFNMLQFSANSTITDKVIFLTPINDFEIQNLLTQVV
jgi:hypothetical protein